MPSAKQSSMPLFTATIAFIRREHRFKLTFSRIRVEIHSPGSLYGRMSIEQLGIAKPDLRNPALAVMAETLTAAEHRYSGIPTMRNAMKEYGLPYRNLKTAETSSW